MEISRSQIRAVSDILDLPCFAFFGEGVSQGGISFGERNIARHLLKVPARPFAQAILDLAATVSLEQSPEIIHAPLTIFGFDPTPTVFTIPSAGIVKINFGMYLSIHSMPYTISWLRSIYGTASSIELDDIDELAVPQQTIDELERVLLWWHRYHSEGKVNIERILQQSMTSQEAEAADTTTHHIFYFVTCHEFAHWVAKITPPDLQQATLNKMRSYLASWPSEDVLTQPKTKLGLVEVFRENQPMFESWVQELHADSLAVQFFLKYFKEQNRQQAQQQVFAAQALTYSLLIQLSEVYSESVLGRPVSWRTHPPSGLRANIFCHVGGKIRGKSQAEFAARDWGIGTFIGLIMERVMSALRLRIGAA